MIITKKKWQTKKIILIAVCILAALLIVGDWALSVTIYNENFNKRFESYEPLLLSVDDYEGLQRTKYEFPSDKGQKLTGYLYSAGEAQRGILVMAHGFGGGGHNSYMDCANYFAQHGYYVFAYDATGNDESEGKGVGGLPQGVIDLDYAISFVEQSGNFADLPIVLFGHSWGGYSACSVLTYRPEVKAVIECSGFNSSIDLFASEGKKQAGNAIYLLLPFVKLHEQLKYGNYASNTALDGFAASNAAIMIVHGADDDVVPIHYGYDTYYIKYGDDPRFSFLRLDNAEHNHIYHDTAYVDAFNTSFSQWLDTLDYDYQAAENKAQFAREKADYIHDNLDRDKWSHMLNLELFETFLEFYDTHLH